MLRLRNVEASAHQVDGAWGSNTQHARASQSKTSPPEPRECRQSSGQPPQRWTYTLMVLHVPGRVPCELLPLGSQNPPSMSGCRAGARSGSRQLIWPISAHLRLGVLPGSPTTSGCRVRAS